jgi:small subunit ribosomal protein S7
MGRSDAATSLISICPRRTIAADEKAPRSTDQPKGPNQDQLPHVSEEAAATGKITGEGGPELEHGTPVEEV